MTITAFDHVAVPIENVREMLTFYRKLGFTVNDSRPPFYAVHFGDNKINMHGPEAWQSKSFTLRGPAARPGCGDFCFLWEGSPSSIIDHLRALSIPVVEGPVERAGGRNLGNATGTSVYVRDPDNNLLEFIVYP
jgi:catechol 2,3-dioxygenase-like lactoylglutathione lyase family enzyme